MDKDSDNIDTNTEDTSYKHIDTPDKELTMESQPERSAKSDYKAIHRRKHIDLFTQLYFYIDPRNYIQALLVVIVPLLITLLIMFYPTLEPKDFDDYTMKVDGTIVSLERVTQWTQGFDGAEEIIKFYVVHYFFTLEDKYYNLEFAIPNTPSNQKYVNLIEENIGNKYFPILYKPSNPKASMPDIFIVDK